MKKIIQLALVFFCTSNFLFGQNNISEKDLLVLKEPAETMMRSYLTGIVDKQFTIRDSLLSTFRTAGDWKAHAQVVRDSMISWTGPLPERTPLNARTTGRLDREGYTIEKILFESRPNYLVSANLYLPKNQNSPRPALLNVIGHAQDGKANERYQRMSIAQAKNGFVVLTMDCVGQGERGLLSSHRIVGAQAIISGTHLFNIMLWDAIRAIDYLVGRPEVDPEKICITGSSGGGMITTYILPFEDRIAVAVPTCNPNTWSYRVHANLATDHEQVFFGTFESGIDPRGDPMFTHVPKPLLLNTTTDDPLNPPRGVWQLNNWLYKAYATHGAPEKVSTYMVKAGHDYNREQREITYAWMLKWTGNDASCLWEEDTPIEKEEDLWAATGGSVFNETGSKQHHDLVLDYLRENKSNWAPLKLANTVNSHQSKMKTLIEEVLNINFHNMPVKFNSGEIRGSGDLMIRPFVLEPEARIVLPGIMLESSNSNDDVVLYIHESGKSEILKDIDVVRAILSSGKRICAVDLRGIGETSPDMANKFWDFLAGKPIFGQRVGDVLAIMRWLKGPAVQAKEIRFWGSGMGALYGAFAGIANNDISAFVFEEPLISFESVVNVVKPEYNYEVLLLGILKKFDMPQVYQGLTPRPITILNPRLGDKTSAGEADLKSMDNTVKATYMGVGKRKAWNISKTSREERNGIIKELMVE